MAATFQEQARQAVPAEVHMISGSQDSQTSEDVFNTGAFELPDPAGKAGGACTSALLKVLYQNTGRQSSWVEVLRQMRQVLKGMKYDQIPQLTSSRLIDVDKPMSLVPPNFDGTKRAVLVGINYVGQQGELRGCHNDVRNMEKYLREVHGFSDSVVLMDDGKHSSPTKRNILNAFERVTKQSKRGDVVFIHYSGHGGRLRDEDGDEDDEYDETLIPLDFKRAGQIRDDDLLRVLVKPMDAGVTMTCLFDSCHSGTVLDLPYRFTSKGSKMHRNDKFRMSRFQAKSFCPWLLNAMNFVAFLGNFIVTYGLGVLGVFGLPTNSDISEKYQTIITPVWWSFSIWAIIFTAQLVWSAGQLFPTFGGSPLVRDGVSWYYIGACLTQMGWTASFSFEFIWFSLLLMVFILLFLVRIVVAQYYAEGSVSINDYLLFKFPFAIHAGWILAASFLNVSVLLVDMGLSASVQYFAAYVSLIGVLIIAGVVLFYPERPEFTIPLVLAWALIGIYTELGDPKETIVNTFESDKIVEMRYAALAFCCVVLALTACALIQSCCRSRNKSDPSTDYTDYRNMVEV